MFVWVSQTSLALTVRQSSQSNICVGPSNQSNIPCTHSSSIDASECFVSPFTELSPSPSPCSASGTDPGSSPCPVSVPSPVSALISSSGTSSCTCPNWSNPKKVFHWWQQGKGGEGGKGGGSCQDRLGRDMFICVVIECRVLLYKDDVVK